jgi:hypothetical protein
MAILEDERTFHDMDVKSTPTGADKLQIADAADGGKVKSILISDLPVTAGVDSNAIHVNAANEIHALTDKPLPLLADEVVAETSTAAAWTKVRMAVGILFKAVGWIDGLTAKTAPTGSDTLPIGDAAASGAPKKSTLQQLFAAIGLIDGLTAKAVPVAADTLPINDSAAAGAAKKSTLQQLFAALGLIDGLTSKATPVAADTLAINDSAAGGAAKKVTLGSLPITQSQVASIMLEPAADAAITLLGTTSAVVFQTASGATTVIADGAGLYAGQEVQIFASAVAGGGKATLAVQGGTLTVDATDEAPTVKRNAANDAWVVISKGGATIV